LDVAQFESEQWLKLKAALLRTGLVQVEVLAGFNPPFLRFHPTLAPVLWGRLTAAEQEELRLRHQEEYYGFVNYWYHLPNHNPEAARVVVRKELANLLWAVNGALTDQAENALDFVERVNLFLDKFGLKRDRTFLTERLDLLVGTVDSSNWSPVRYMQGTQLFYAGQYAAAANLFAEILQGLATEPSFERVLTLLHFGRCLSYQGQLSAAADCLREALSLSGQLDQSDPIKSDPIKKQRNSIYSELGDVLAGLGEYASAQQAYEESLKIIQETNNRGETALMESRLGNLASTQRDLSTATQRYQSALQIFQQLGEPDNVAVVWHQLGIVYQDDQQWAAADRAYRESARIKEQQGNITGAASTYGQLAILNKDINKLAEAEDWYRKTLQSFQVVGNRLGESRILFNLADLRAKQSRSLEARQLATADWKSVKLSIQQQQKTGTLMISWQESPLPKVKLTQPANIAN
jgi:tetratricopeptide (TPR) repeat protein